MTAETNTAGNRAPQGAHTVPALEAGLVGSRRRGEEACSNPAGVVGEGTEVGNRGRVGRVGSIGGVA